MTETITVALDPELKSRLERLARETHRSGSALAAEAIAAYVDLNAWQMDQIRDGLAEADRGEMVDHEDVLREMAEWRAAIKLD